MTHRSTSPLEPNNYNKLTGLNNYLKDVKSLIATNVLQFNENKSEVLLFGPQNLTNMIYVHLDTFALLLNHIKSSLIQPHIVSKLRSVLWRKSSPKIWRHRNAFISSRLHYSNSFYFGITKFSLSCLQLVQIAAGRLLHGSKKKDHIAP